MKLLTFMTLDEIAEYEKLEGSAINSAKERLAHELTQMVHGKDEADKALSAAKNVFAAGGLSENMPTTELADDSFTDGSILVSDMLVLSGLAPSKGEAKRIITGGGVSVGDRKAEGFGTSCTKEEFEGEGLILKKGKKTFHRFILK